MTYRFISDLHLSEARPDLTEAFLSFLKRSESECEQLYILGDLFEIWIGDDSPSALNLAVKNALKHTSDLGVKTFFIHGNRDFLIGDTFALETGIEILPDPFSFKIGEKDILLSHGDFLCTDDVDYINFRNEVRSPDWQKNFLSKSLEERRQIADALRADSKEATMQKAEEITDVNQAAVESLLKAENPDIFIHGHTHRPNIHKVTLGDANYDRIVLGDWGPQGWYLDLNTDTYTLEKFDI